MSKKWNLTRTVQCAKCPWKKSTNPHDIPNGYCPTKHAALEGTIAKGVEIPGLGSTLKIMACHEEHEAHCVGWLANQAGPGNNIGLRISLMTCANARDIRTVGEQHETFEDTLP